MNTLEKLKSAIDSKEELSNLIEIVSRGNLPIVNREYLVSLLKLYFSNPIEAYLRYLEIVEKEDSFKRVAYFEEVSFEQFKKDIIGHNLGSENNIDSIFTAYEYVSIPKRSTKGSAGYDFITPIDIVLKPGEKVVVCTGVRCCMLENWVLKAYPRSSSGSRYRVQFNNTVPVLDSDYYFTENEGHIMFTITNDSKEGKVFELKAGEKICQGVFVEYGITIDDDVQTYRIGGFGSTGR